tara:strand:+ start:3562 stop:4086 length:525 start_codon:yes stop_codon:yes gene_type:complete
VEPIVTVSTTIETHEDPIKVIEAVKGIFPQWKPDDSIDLTGEITDSNGFTVWGVVDSMEDFLIKIRELRILDTAMDVMSMKLKDGVTEFNISKQSASVGKISFALEEGQFGGMINICLEGKDLGLWMEQHTWHSGRDLVPRSIGDSLAMDESGEAAEWFVPRGRKTRSDGDLSD